MLGFLFGQGPDSDKSAANPSGQFLTGYSYAWRSRDPETKELQTDFQVDSNFILNASRFGPMNNVTTTGLFNALLDVNLSLPKNINLEFAGGVNVAAKEQPASPSDPLHLVRPLSGRAAVGLGWTTTFKEGAFSIEGILSKELNPNVADDKGTTGWKGGPLSLTINIGISIFKETRPKLPRRHQPRAE